MELSLDVGSFILGCVTAIILPGIAYLWSRQQRKKEAEQEARQKAYERRQQAYEEQKEAFAIHAALTEISVLEALGRGHRDEAAMASLVALHTRSALRFVAFSDGFGMNRDFSESIEAALRAIHVKFPAETLAAQGLFDQNAEIRREQSQNHSKNPNVQERMSDFASRLAGRVVGRGESSDVDVAFRDVMESLKLTKAGQAVTITLPGGKNKIWFAGSGSGLVPAGVHHIDASGCMLNLAKTGLKTRLQVESQDGRTLAEAFVRELRELGDTHRVCTCGVPFTFG